MKIDIIIPLINQGEKYGEVIERLKNSIKDIEEVSIQYVCGTKEDKERFSELFKGNLGTNILSTGKDNENIQSLINYAASKSKASYIIFLKEEDNLYPTWIQNVIKHINYYTEFDSFLGLCKEVDKDGKFISYYNELVLSGSFLDENRVGEITLDMVNTYGLFLINGGVFNRKKFLANGGLKPSMKRWWETEFLMRTLNNGSRIYMIPKLSSAIISGPEIPVEDSEEWLHIAQREYFFNTDRNIQPQDKNSDSKKDVVE